VHGNELWSSDGTEAGTVLVKDIRPGDYDAYPSNLTAVGDAVFFRARDGVNGRELWTSDGTAAGTRLVADINPGANESRPQSLTESGGALFFSANDRVHGEELWISDGTEAGTTMIKDINTGGAFEVSSRGDANPDNGTVRVRTYVDGSGTIVVEPAGKRWIKRIERDVTSSDTSRVYLTLEPTRAAKRELRRTGRLDVRAKFTFTSCGGGVKSVTKGYTLRLR
jgi:ELWxxDGT repeat protein